MSAQIQHIFPHRRSCRPRPNPDAESVLTRGHSSSAGSRTGQEDKETYLLRPIAAVRPMDPPTHPEACTHSHAHAHTHNHEDFAGQWYQRWTHTQL